jgi:microcystin-dependent protein
MTALSSMGSTVTMERRRFLARTLAAIGGVALLGRTRPAEAQTAVSGPYLGQIMLISWNFAQKGWAFCNGQLLPINQNQALFSLLGTTYGGDGRLTFALPDLRGRVAIHSGQGPGLTARTRGTAGGETAHTLTVPELPTHTHVGRAGLTLASSALPSSSLVPARNPGLVPQWGPTVDATMATDAIGTTGGSQPHENTQPYLVLNYVIALQGVFPSP